eukprot:TRINITY_DN10645_c0_g1_i2.p1 TRINITY_DN10645_c0_g1~~TRINITY_DN10645_c0_g1_i2.p1  ORF type:complete len:301 (-),score=61.95 TRINITY_DN10645_c0_g1_i2:143-1045(-)
MLGRPAPLPLIRSIGGEASGGTATAPSEPPSMPSPVSSSGMSRSISNWNAGSRGFIGVAGGGGHTVPWDIDSTQPSVNYAPSLSPRSSYSVGASVSAGDVAAMTGQGKEILEALRSLTRKLDGVSLVKENAIQESGTVSAPVGKVTAPIKSGFRENEASDGKRGREDNEPIFCEMYRELEGLELALAKERQRVSTLTEEKLACETAHARDISALEAMLNQVMSERDELKVRSEKLLAENTRLREDNRRHVIRARHTIVGTLADLKEADVQVKCDTSDPEPEVERSVNDSDRYSCRSGSSR